MTVYQISPIENANLGIARERALCAHYNIMRTKHDSLAYDKGSDLDVGDKHISIKASGFSLMSGSLCEGKTTFAEIWDLYQSRVHSNIFAYITMDYTVYEMNINEFKEFVFTFGRLCKESSSHGGQLKIRCIKESGKARKWLAEHSAN